MRKPLIIKHKGRRGKFWPFQSKPKHIHHHHTLTEVKKNGDSETALAILGVIILIGGGIVAFAVLQPLLFVCLIGAIGFGVWYFNT